MAITAESENAPLNTAPDSAAPLDSGQAERAQSGKGAGPSTPSSPPNGTLAPALSAFEVERASNDHEPSAKWYHAAFHSITCMVGAGVLALPFSFSYLTWGGGLFFLSFSTAVSLYCSHLLAELHEGPEGRRYNRYRELGAALLGRKLGLWVVVPIQFVVCVGLDIAYTLTAGQSLQAVQNPACNAHTVSKEVHHTEQGCATALTWWTAGFAGLQIILSQVKDLHSLWWVSLIGALMSALYSAIAFALSLAAIPEGGVGSVDHSMRPGSPADRTYGVMNALGTMLFAFGGQAVQLEIQATLARPPSTYTAMMNGIYVAYVLIISAYFGVSITGFAAFGNTINPDVLLSISEPDWLIKAANIMVVIHVAASFQLFAHSVYEATEQGLAHLLFKKSPQPEAPQWLKASNRTLYCAFCAAIAILLPFFNDVIGLVGSAGFVPLSFIFPSLFYILSRKYKGRWEYWLNVGVLVVMTTVGSLAVLGSLRNLIVKAKAYHY